MSLRSKALINHCCLSHQRNIFPRPSIRILQSLSVTWISGNDTSATHNLYNICAFCRYKCCMSQFIEYPLHLQDNGPHRLHRRTQPYNQWLWCLCTWWWESSTSPQFGDQPSSTTPLRSWTWVWLVKLTIQGHMHEPYHANCSTIPRSVHITQSYIPSYSCLVRLSKDKTVTHPECHNHNTLQADMYLK